MRRDGLSLAEIARRLGITRQAVHNVMGNIEDQVARTLESVASAAKIDVRYIDTTKGILLGYSYETENRVIVTFSTRHGAQIWHYHTGKCEGCASNRACRELILGEAEERGIALDSKEENRTPTELARLVFSRVIPGLEP
jgi:transcriptional regulator with XRE-family HTH domain